MTTKTMTVTTTDNEHDFAFSDIAKCLFHLSIQLQSSCSPAAGMFLSYESLPSLYSHNYNKGLFTKSQTLIWKKGQSRPIPLKHYFVLQWNWNWNSCFSGLTLDLSSYCTETKSQPSFSLIGHYKSFQCN